MNEPHFLVIPVDSRPVCYDQVADLAAIAGLHVAMPPRNLFGVLKTPADHDSMLQWWTQYLALNPQSAMILALDTLTYGGLIPSRVNTESAEVLRSRLQGYLSQLREGHRPRYAFSSILRIPNYNNAEEEPDYWAEYGSLLYQFSEETHLQKTMPDHLFNKIPGRCIEDFMSRRQKNFGLNKELLNRVETKELDYLIYCQDDTGPYGLNVQEAEYFKSNIQKRRLQSKIIVQTGADEAALILLARSLWQAEKKPLKIYPWFFPEHGKKVMAKFDGMPIANVVQRQITTLGGVMCLNPQDADLVFIINCPMEKMGDHCTQEPIIHDRTVPMRLVEALKPLLPTQNVAIADVVYANGADSFLLNACLEAGLPMDRLAAYAGWNTPGNTIGCALAMGSVAVWAQRYDRLNDEARRRLLMKRLLDDWIYQSDVRLKLRRKFPELPPESELNTEMQEGMERLLPMFRLNQMPSFSFPCNRLFEIAVNL